MLKMLGEEEFFRSVASFRKFSVSSGGSFAGFDEKLEEICFGNFVYILLKDP